MTEGEMLKALQSAILKAFPTPGKLKQMVSFQFSEDLDVLVGGEDLGEVVFNLIKWSQSSLEGKIEEFVAKARQEKPDNQDLCEFERKFLKKDSQQTKIELPFIIMAMKGKEAQTVLQASSFPLQEAFQHLDTSKCYGNHPSEWKPFFPEEIGIESCLCEVIECFNTHLDAHPYKEKYKLAYVEPCWDFSEDFFDEQKADHISQELKARYGGCILIADALSFFSSKLTQILKNYPRTIEMMFILSPRIPQTDRIYQVIDEQIRCELPEPYQNLSQFTDFSRGLIIEGRNTFQRWLYMLLPEMIHKQIEQRKEVYRAAIKKRTEGYKERDVGEIVANRGLNT